MSNRSENKSDILSRGRWLIQVEEFSRRLNTSNGYAVPVNIHS